MFGPDICGSTKRVHLIFTYKGQNHLLKKQVACESDSLTHLYTMILHPDNTYEILIDYNSVAKGSLAEDWDILPPKEILDPNSEKPKDWVDESEIPDPEDKKPEGWDDIPAQIVDPDATKPEDWDDELDGEWEAPQIDNPAYKGAWKAKSIPNPAYKGAWVHPKIPNPDYVDDPNIYLYENNCYAAFELWQVKSGTIFDNILVTDSLDEAKKYAEDTTLKSKDAEKKMKEDKDEEERKKFEEQAKNEAAAQAEEGGDDEEDEDGHVHDEL